MLDWNHGDNESFVRSQKHGTRPRHPLALVEPNTMVEPSARGSSFVLLANLSGTHYLCMNKVNVHLLFLDGPHQ